MAEGMTKAERELLLHIATITKGVVKGSICQMEDLHQNTRIWTMPGEREHFKQNIEFAHSQLAKLDELSKVVALDAPDA